MVDRFLLQLLEQRLGVAETVVDQLGELARRLLALRGARHCQKKLWFHSCALLLNSLSLPGALRFLDDLDQRSAGQARPRSAISSLVLLT